MKVMCVLFGWVTLIGLAELATTRADDVITMPAGVDPPIEAPRRDPAAEEQIRRVLQSPQSVGPVNDPMLGDVLSVLKKRRSVLEGSLLDKLSPREVSTDEKLQEPDPKLAKPTDSKGNGVQKGKWLRKRAKAAEAMLKASRLLDKLEAENETHRHLVKKLRDEAARLLNRSPDALPNKLLIDR